MLTLRVASRTLDNLETKANECKIITAKEKKSKH